MTGRWTVDAWSNGRVFIQSHDFKHDVALEINGDFGTPEDELEYAKELCRRLNAMEPVIK